MSRENVAVVRDAVEAVNAGDVDRALAVLDPAIVARVHDLPDVPVYHGLAGIAQWRSDWERSWATWHWVPEAFVPAGDRVVAVLRTVAQGHSSGIEVERVTGAVFRLRGGKVIELDYYATKAEALEAAGLTR